MQRNYRMLAVQDQYNTLGKTDTGVLFKNSLHYHGGGVSV